MTGINPLNQPTTMKKPLASFRYATRQNVATIGRNQIMRVTTARTLQWWLVLPAYGENDHPCILLHKCGKLNDEWAISQCEPKIIAEETARAAA